MRDVHSPCGASLRAHHPPQSMQEYASTKIMKMIALTPRAPIKTLALLSGELAHPKMGEGGGWEPEMRLPSLLPDPSFAAGSPWHSSRDAGNCAL